MKMKEAEIRTGLDRKNIRYYESEGLLTPERAKNSQYREYSEEDIERLLTIKLLRQLGIPIRDIRGYLEERITLGEIMKLRVSQIDTEVEQLKKAGQMCARLKEQPYLNTKEVEQYLQEIREEETNGSLFQDIRKDWAMYKKELHEQYIYFEPEGTVLTPEEFALETALYAQRNNFSYETVRLDKRYALIRLEGILYQASLTYIPGFRLARLPMIRLVRCTPPEHEISLIKYTFFSILPILLVVAGLFIILYGTTLFPLDPGRRGVLLFTYIVVAILVCVARRNIHFNA